MESNLLVPDYILRKLILLYGFTKEIQSKIREAQLNPLSYITYENYSIINGEWLNKFKEFYNYEQIAKIIQYHKYDFPNYIKYKNNIEKILSTIKQYKLYQKEIKFPDELKILNNFYPTAKCIVNNLKIHDNFYIVNSELNKLLSHDKDNPINPNYPAFVNKKNLNVFLNKYSYFIFIDNIEICTMDKDGMFVHQYCIKLEELSTVPEIIKIIKAGGIEKILKKKELGNKTSAQYDSVQNGLIYNIEKIKKDKEKHKKDDKSQDKIKENNIVLQNNNNNINQNQINNNNIINNNYQNQNNNQFIQPNYNLYPQQFNYNQGQYQFQNNMNNNMNFSNFQMPNMFGNNQNIFQNFNNMNNFQQMNQSIYNELQKEKCENQKLLKSIQIEQGKKVKFLEESLTEEKKEKQTLENKFQEFIKETQYKMIDLYNINQQSKGNSDSKESMVKIFLDKDKEIDELKTKLKRYPFELEEGENMMTVNFISTDNKIQNYSIICKNTEVFYNIEKRLYEGFNEFYETENYFTVNGNIINKDKSLEENKVKNNDVILLNKY